MRTTSLVCFVYQLWQFYFTTLYQLPSSRLRWFIIHKFYFVYCDRRSLAFVAFFTALRSVIRTFRTIGHSGQPGTSAQKYHMRIAMRIAADNKRTAAI